MGLIDVGHILVPTPMSPKTNQSMLIDAADELIYTVMQAHKAGNIRYVHFKTGGVTSGGSNDQDIRIETVDGSGQPSGTLWGTNTNVAMNIIDTDDYQWLRSPALTADAAVNKGDMFAMVLKNPSTNFGNIQVDNGCTIGNGLCYCGAPLASSTKQTGPTLFAEYSDGTFVIQPGYAGDEAYIWLTNASNPDEVCLKFTADVPMRVTGWWTAANNAAGADYRLSLYEDGNNTPLLTNNYDGDSLVISGANIRTGLFSSSYTLVKGTVYRLGILLTTATGIYVNYTTSPTSYTGLFTGMNGMQSASWGQRNRSSTTDPDSAAWTDYDYRRPLIGLVVDQLHDGTGGGSGTTFFVPVE